MSKLMRSRGFRLTVIICLGLTLSACSVFRDRGQDYRRAKLSKPLELPADSRSDAMTDRYSVPNIQGHEKLEGKFEVPPPEPIARNVGRAEVRIQKLDDNYWILLDGQPGQTWPQIRAFMNTANLEVARADLDQGVLETQWLEPRGGGARERYRFRVEAGVQASTAEIHILHALDDGTNRWPGKSSNPEREADLVKLLAQYLANTDSSKSAVSVLAKRERSKGKIFLEGTGDYAFLRVLLPYERAWGALGLAMVKAGFEIEESSQNVNKYWVTYVDPQTENPGWFRRYFLGAAKAPVSRYMVEMKPVGEEEMLVYLNYQKGRRLRETERQRVLTRIMGYLY